MDSSPPPLNYITQRLVCTAIVLCLLYVGKDILMPTVVAIVLSFSLMPLVRRLQHVGLNRTLSVVAVVTFACVVFGHVMLTMGSQLVRIAESLPQYEYNIRNKISSIDDLTLGKLKVVLEKANGLVGGLGRTDRSAAKAGGAGKRAATDVMTVRLEEKEQAPPAAIAQAIGSIVHFAENVGLALVVLIFVLLDYEELRDRLIRLIGGRNFRETTTALNEAGNKLTRYFGAQVAVNVLSGSVVGLALYGLGVPEATFWGALTAVARFIPYIGAWIAMASAFLMAAAVVPGWSLALGCLGVFVAVEMSVAQIIEPKLYGHTTGLSPLSVVIGAIFWAGLWGPVGLILATPLTLLLVVAGRYVRALHFIELLLGDVPGLSAAERFYQRALSGDARELVINLRQYLRKRTASEYCDHVLVPFMSLAKEDFSQRAITQLEMKNLTQTVTAILGLLEQPARSRKVAQGRGDVMQDSPGTFTVIYRDDPVSDMYANLVLAVLKSNGVAATLSRTLAGGDDPLAPVDEAGTAILIAADLAGIIQDTANYVLEYVAAHRGRKCLAFIPDMSLLQGQSLPSDFPALLNSCRAIQLLCDELFQNQAVDRRRSPALV